MKIVKCRDCGKEIVFLTTERLKKVPVNTETVSEGETRYIHGKHISHFSDCPGANKFRKPKEVKA